MRVRWDAEYAGFVLDRVTRMEIIVVNQEQVADLLPMEEAMGAMRDVLADLARGNCHLPLRQIMWLPERFGALGLMPSYWEREGMIGLKAVTFFPGNEGTERDTHQGAVLLYDARDGRLCAVIDATSVTAIRTAAVSAVATECLARLDSRRLTIVGSGVQAAHHLEAMRCCRAIESVAVVSQSMDRAARFSRAMSNRHGLAVRAMESVEQAVADADIICTTTSSAEAVLRGRWIKPGTHINAVGSSVASARELDGEAVQKARLYVDRRESAMNEAGDFLLAKKEGFVGEDHIVGEVGELLIGKVAGRREADEVTLFKSVGLAVEDLAAAVRVYKKAQSGQSGSKLAFGGRRHAVD